jgi:hypothetical protein
MALPDHRRKGWSAEDGAVSRRRSAVVVSAGFMTATPQSVAPEIDGSIYRWRLGELSLDVDAAYGARIVGFRIGAENILTGPEVNALNFGSTFWTSPQADWNWPPLAELDSEPYTVTGAGDDLAFTSDPADGMGVAVTKRFHVDHARETVEVAYRIENRGAVPRTVAPWEISRVPTGGLTFFPVGTGVQPPSTLKVREIDGVVWFDYDAQSITDHQKMFAHGSEGWLAHIDLPRRMLFLKTFDEIEPTAQAPGQAQIELYADPGHSYVEVEQQGACRAIEPGGHADWSVTWRLRRVPLGLDIVAGNKSLLALVRALVAPPHPKPHK